MGGCVLLSTDLSNVNEIHYRSQKRSSAVNRRLLDCLFSRWCRRVIRHTRWHSSHYSVDAASESVARHRHSVGAVAVHLVSIWHRASSGYITVVKRLHSHRACSAGSRRWHWDRDHDVTESSLAISQRSVGHKHRRNTLYVEDLCVLVDLSGRHTWIREPLRRHARFRGSVVSAPGAVENSGTVSSSEIVLVVSARRTLCPVLRNLCCSISMTSHPRCEVIFEVPALRLTRRSWNWCRSFSHFERDCQVGVLVPQEHILSRRNASESTNSFSLCQCSYFGRACRSVKIRSAATHLRMKRPTLRRCVEVCHFERGCRGNEIDLTRTHLTANRRTSRYCVSALILKELAEMLKRSRNITCFRRNLSVLVSCSSEFRLFRCSMGSSRIFFGSVSLRKSWKAVLKVSWLFAARSSFRRCQFWCSWKNANPKTFAGHDRLYMTLSCFRVTAPCCRSLTWSTQWFTIFENLPMRDDKEKYITATQTETTFSSSRFSYDHALYVASGSLRCNKLFTFWTFQFWKQMRLLWKCCSDWWRSWEDVS